MDKYLESLVLKGEIHEEPVEDVKEEEVVEEIKEAVTEETAEPEIPDSDPEPVEEIKEELEADEKKPEPKKEEPKKAAKKSSEGETVSVIDIKIFNTPDPKGPFKIYSGNVVVGSKVSDMTCIEYVKPGFGLVKGFTADLK